MSTRPSDRIAEMAKVMLADVERRAHPHNFAKYRDVYVDKCFTRAVVRFLDDAFDANLMPATAAALADRTTNLNERVKKLERALPLARELAEVHVGDGDELGDTARELLLTLGPEAEHRKEPLT